MWLEECFSGVCLSYCFVEGRGELYAYVVECFVGV